MPMEAPKLIIHGIKEEPKRACIPSVEEARSESRLVEVEALVPLARQKASYSTSVKVI